MLEGLIIRHVTKNEDSRGWLAEIFRADELPDLLNPKMGYVSMTNPGISRGPHEHLEQTDYFCFPGISRFRVYLWDNNPQSATYRQSQTFETSERFPVIAVVPPGIVHAYKNIGNIPGLVLNFPNKLYRGVNKSGQVDEIRHEDAADSKYRLD